MSFVNNKGAGSVPDAPDAKTTIAAQQASNLQTAQQTQQLNQTSQITPNGALTYVRDPNNPNNVVAVQSLSPQMQGIQGKALGGIDSLLDQSGNQIGTPITQASIGGMAAQAPLGQVDGVPTQVPSYSDFSGSAQQLQNSVLQRLQPNMDQQQQQLDTSLRNQGLAPGSQAYNTAERQMSQQQNDLRLGAVQTGDQEQLQQYGAALQGYQSALQGQGQQYSQAFGNAQLNNSAISQNLQDQTTIQSTPYSLAQLALGGGLNGNLGLTQTPTTSVSPTDVLGAYQNSYQDRLASNQESYQRSKQTIQSIMQIASAAAA